MNTLVNSPAYKGPVDFGIYNVWNKDYRTGYSQQSEITFSTVPSMRA
jgi:iron complex outermembrane receptor protein